MTSKRRSARLALMLPVVLLASLMVATTPAGAVPNAPTGLSPNGVSVGGNPQLTWTAVSGALDYRVQISTSPTFTVLWGNFTTVNTTYTPLTEIPPGLVYWRVNARDASGSSAYTEASFTKTLAGPTLTSPANGATITYPTTAVTYAWDPLPSVKSYEIQIDDAPDFIGNTKYTTSGTSFTITNTQELDQTVYWRVRGASGTGGGGVLTDWSATRTYVVTWSTAPVLLSPPNDTLVNDIQDIVLHWQPIIGADSYDVVVSLSSDFSGAPVYSGTVTGTYFSPATTFGNASYYWHVRGRDTGNHLGPWSATWGFKRGWQVAPNPTFPLNGSNPAEPITYSWDPIEHASHYEVRIGTDVNFSPGTFLLCETMQTSVNFHLSTAPSSIKVMGDCFDKTSPNSYSATMYWQVRGLDGPSSDTAAGTASLWSPVQAYTVQIPYPNKVSPADGADVSVPVLDWDPSSGAKIYRVKVWDKDGVQVLSVDTRATSFVPMEVLDPLQSPFRWNVQPIDMYDHVSPTPALGSSPSFTMIDHPITTPTIGITSPTAGGTSFEMPLMQWTPVTNATKYEVWRSDRGLNVFVKLNSSDIVYPAYVHPGVRDDAKNYDWFVRAYDSGDGLIDESSFCSPVCSDWYTLQAWPEVTMVAPDDCPPGCSASQPSNPPIDFDHVDGASYYIVYLALDASFTQIYRTDVIEQDDYIYREELQDNNAGQAYYWHVRPCQGIYGTGPQFCGPDPVSSTPPHRAFQKRSAGIVLTSPANTATVADEIRFVWEDYLTSNNSDVEAYQYEIEVSTDPAFPLGARLELVKVDQTSYAPLARTYPEGPIYWRVRSYYYKSTDPNTWSPVRVVNKTSAPVTLSAPADGATVNGQPTFAWLPQGYAGQYVLEVAKNGDTNFSPSNIVVNITTAQAQYTPPAMLAPGDYAWRVRRKDGFGLDGPNSVVRTFTIGTNLAPTLISPAEGVFIGHNDLVFSWTPVVGAASYKFERATDASFVSGYNTITTIMTSYAPTSPLPNSLIYWKVSALDALGNVIGTSAPVRTFTHETRNLPSAPTNLAVVNAGGRATLSWTAPTSPGNPIFTRYIVRISPAPDGWTDRTINAPTSTTVINGLINGVAYDVEVRAVSTGTGGGEGPPATIVASPNGCLNTPFFDVPATSTFCDAIAWMYQSNITTGSTLADGTKLFSPGAAVTRQAMASFLYKYQGSPGGIPTIPYFSDVSNSHPFFVSIQWMYLSGLSTGTPNPPGLPLYKPADPVSRQAMAAFLHRIAGNAPPASNVPYFADVANTNAFFSHIQWMYEQGISTGTPQTPPKKPLYKPLDSVSRQAMASFLFRLDQLP